MAQLSTKYIETALDRGQSEENIRETLRIQGINEADVNEAFKIVREEKEKKDVQPQSQSPQPQPQPQSPQKSEQSQQPVPPEKRMQYSHKTELKKVIWIIAVSLIVLGAATGYFYYNELLSWMGIAPTTPLEPAPSVSPAPVIPSPIIIPEEPETTVLSEDPDDLKIDNIIQTQLSLSSYHTENGSYPETVSVGDDSDAFYCYRKNGSHYILGTVLSEGHIALTEDLDGDYNCGDVVKSCADPVYCVGP